MGILDKMLNRQPSGSTHADRPSPNPIRMSGTTVGTLKSNPHKSDSLTEQVDTGLEGNDYEYPTAEIGTYETGSSNRRQDIARTYLSDGPNPSRIPFIATPGNWNGKLGRDGSQFGDVGFLLNISGNAAGGMGDAQFIPHVSILRPAGMARGAMRTIDDGAMVPGVYVADPTRR
jgi:hypothetical protein